MSTSEALRQLKSEWIARVERELTRRASPHPIFLPQLKRLHRELLSCVEHRDATRLNRLLDEWVEEYSSTDIADRDLSVQPLFELFLLITTKLVREQLPPEAALEALEVVLPIFSHALQYIARLEATLYTEHILGDLYQARMQLEGLDRSKSDFIAIAAHELKTPLTLIEGYTAILKEFISPDRPEMERLMQGIEGGTTRLRAIVSDMIDVSLIDNDLLNLTFQPVGLSHLLRMVEREYAPRAEERRIALTFEFFDGSRELLMGDPERLYQALSNLVSNGIKYTPDGGWVRVTGRRLPGFVEISVSDNGIGIAPENQVRIFEKFTNLGDAALHSTSKTRYKGGGPGLGLSITKGIIEAHGGAIWAESEGFDEHSCPGSTFHVLLPLRVEPPDEKINRLFQSGELLRTLTQTG